MLAALIVLFVIVALLGYLVGIYNELVRVSAAVKLAWSNIDVLLVQRHDELPKLVEVCKQYMQYERDTLERVMKARAGVATARSSGDVSSVGVAENQLRTGLTGLYAVAERYPDLKANDAFRQLQSRISGLETAIADRREAYNDSVNANNVRIRAFPDVLIAGLGNFPPAKLLQFQAEEKASVDMKAMFAA
jgi:LemA protein